MEAGPGVGREVGDLLGGDVADRPGQLLDQEVDERLEVMPVLVGFGVEDDVAVARRKLLKAAIAGPVLPHLHGARRRRSRRAAPSDALLVRGGCAVHRSWARPALLAANPADQPV